MTITPDDIKVSYPEFNGIDDDAIAALITTYQSVVRVERWGELADEGLSARVAHELAVKYAHQLQLGAAVKALQTQDPFQFNTKGEKYFDLTPYGKKYYQLLGSLPHIGMMVI